MLYLPTDVKYQPGEPRCFLAFEDRKRDLSGLLDFGTAIQIFPSSAKWQLTNATTAEFQEALRAYFRAHDFTDQDFIVAIGDPVVIAILTRVAADQNVGKVGVLKWDRLKCHTCERWTCSHGSFGRYEPIYLRFPVDTHRANTYIATTQKRSAAPNPEETK